MAYDMLELACSADVFASSRARQPTLPLCAGRPRPTQTTWMGRVTSSAASVRTNCLLRFEAPVGFLVAFRLDEGSSEAEFEIGDSSLAVSSGYNRRPDSRTILSVGRHATIRPRDVEAPPEGSLAWVFVDPGWCDATEYFDLDASRCMSQRICEYYEIELKPPTRFTDRLCDLPLFYDSARVTVAVNGIGSSSVVRYFFRAHTKRTRCFSHH